MILASAVTLIREFQLLYEGIGEAVGSIFSVYVGEENHEGLRTSYALANRAAIVEGIAVTLFLVPVAPLVPRFPPFSKVYMGTTPSEPLRGPPPSEMEALGGGT